VTTEQPKPKSPQLNLLLVDDNRDLRQATGELLRAGGWRVVEAGTAEEALELAGRQSFAVLVSDVSMPGMDGPELVTRLRRRHPGLRCLLVSSQEGRADVERLVAQEEVLFLSKPYSNDQLSRALQQLPSPLPRVRSRRYLALAAIALLAASFAGWWLRTGPPPLPPAAASGVVRGSTIEPLQPIGEQIQLPDELSWREIDQAASYRLSLREVDENLLWQVQVDFSPAGLPDEVRALLRPGVAYFWQVEALDSTGARLAWSRPVRFRRVAEADEAAVLNSEAEESEDLR